MSANMRIVAVEEHCQTFDCSIRPVWFRSSF